MIENHEAGAIGLPIQYADGITSAVSITRALYSVLALHVQEISASPRSCVITGYMTVCPTQISLWTRGFYVAQDKKRYATPL